jgi:primosomal protein N' (replication factor Y)
VFGNRKISLQNKKKAFNCQEKRRTWAPNGGQSPSVGAVKMDAYVEVAVPLPLFQTFAYHVPGALGAGVGTGRRVRVPFGEDSPQMGQRTLTGYVLGPWAGCPPRATKPIAAVLDEAPLFTPSMVAFFRWIADYYVHPVGQVIATGLPNLGAVHDTAVFALTPLGRQALTRSNDARGVDAVLQALSNGPLVRRKLVAVLGNVFSPALISRVVEKGLVACARKLPGKAAGPATERIVRLIGGNLPQDRHLPRRQQILEALAAGGDMSVGQLRAVVPRAAAYLGFLKRIGVITIEQRPVLRDLLGEPIAADTPPILTGEQQAVVDRVLLVLGKRHAAFMLAGVTGSGKTEVYLNLAAAAVAKGLTALVLVPEIALIAQIARRFRARFGLGLALLHSALSVAERREQWLRICRGEAKVVIGARSALFAPLSDLGLIVVDEEHDASYKQDSGLRYNARDMAVVRAKLDGAVVVLGSATPSIQTHHNALNGKFTPLRLTRRVQQRPMPAIEVVDLRRDHGGTGSRRFLSTRLQTAMAETLGQGNQVLLFLNRRGFAPQPICGACGQGLRCTHCDISLTLHRAADVYQCHFCGFTRPADSRCPSCGADRIRPLGLGTEKLEQLVRDLFPSARVGRLDRDSAAPRGALVTILKGLQTRSIDVLVGTQMVAKGHDFPYITLVGIICADLSLNVPDFRAGERTFQILAQVAGRAGRGKAPGRVILQTFNPDHFGIQAAKNQDYESFYRREIVFRRQLGYPPFKRLLLLTVSGTDLDLAAAHARQLGLWCRQIQTAQQRLFGAVELLGPVEAALPRLAGRHRWQLLVKAPYSRVLNGLMRSLIERHPEAFRPKNVLVAVDIDPVDML